MQLEDRILRASEKKSMAKIFNQISSIETIVGLTYPLREFISDVCVAFVITTESSYQIGLDRDDNYIVTRMSPAHPPSLLSIDDSIISYMKLIKSGINKPESKRWIN